VAIAEAKFNEARLADRERAPLTLTVSYGSRYRR
jgi:hypothetical protein